MDPKKLLEQFLGPQGGAPGGTGFGDLLRQAGGALQGRGQPGSSVPASGQSGLGGVIPGALGGLAGQMGGFGGGMAAGGLLGVLLGSKKVRKVAGGALGYGGMAVLGALAYRAYQNWQQGQEPSPPPGDLPVEAPARELALLSHQAADGRPFALALILAMVAAANADGHIDASEQKTIFDAVERAGLAGDEKAFLFDALRKPQSALKIAALAAGPEQASQIYLASRLAIDADDPREKAYLDALSRGLNLPGELVAHLDTQIAGM